MSSESIIVSELAFLGDGALLEFSINVRAQRVFLEAQCPVEGYSTLVNVRGEFEGVVYLALANDQPMFLSGENGLDRFEELPDSTLPKFVEDLAGVQEALSRERNLLVLDDRAGWQFLVTDFGTATIGAPKKRIRLRHFIIQSSSLSARWLCQSATFELTPEHE